MPGSSPVSPGTSRSATTSASMSATAGPQREPEPRRDPGGRRRRRSRRSTFGHLRDRSDRLAAGLRARGVVPGDRVGVLLPQSAAVVIAHAAAYKLGAIALPLAGLFGPDALRYRLADAGARRPGHRRGRPLQARARSARDLPDLALDRLRRRRAGRRPSADGPRRRGAGRVRRPSTPGPTIRP